QHEPLIPVNMLRFLAHIYAGAYSPKDPYLSPVFADFTGFPPLLVQVGSTEILLSDAQRVAEAARRAKVPVQLSVYTEMMHVFQAAAYYIPDGKESARGFGRFIHTDVGGFGVRWVDVFPLQGMRYLWDLWYSLVTTIDTIRDVTCSH